MNSTPIRYRGDLYRAWYNGHRYYLKEVGGNSTIDLYKKGRGVWGLETNKVNPF